MKKMILVLLFIANLYAVENFQDSKTCKGCHPTIYNEYYGSAHRKSSIYEDSAHKAIWDKHPNKEKNKYTCAKCHTPTDTRVIEALENGENSTPQKDNLQTQEAVSCIYCHSIKSIESHTKRYNSNVMAKQNSKRPLLYSVDKNNQNKKVIYKEKTSFFGMFKSTTGSPYHDIDYTNKDYYSGQICMGCHSHFKNNQDIDICVTSQDGVNTTENNCISCHMPQVNGSATTIKITKKHAFHGFAGSRNHQNLVAKYLEISFKKLSDGFEIILKNKAPHKLFIQTLRMAQMDVKIINNSNSKKLESYQFAQIIGKDSKEVMPWLATEVLSDNMLKANETRVIKYDTKLNQGDEVEVEFGYYLVNPSMHKALDLQKDIEATKYHILKSKSFTVQ
jgi:hypothetical protein